MAISRAGNTANIRHLPREFSPLVIAECNPPLQAEKTFFHFVFRSPCCPVIVWSLPLVEIEFSAFSFSLLHVLASNSCMYSLKKKKKNPSPSFSLWTGLLSGLNLMCYTDRLQIYPSESCNMFSFFQLSSTALFFHPRQLQILVLNIQPESTALTITLIELCC